MENALDKQSNISSKKIQILDNYLEKPKNDNNIEAVIEACLNNKELIKELYIKKQLDNKTKTDEKISETYKSIDENVSEIKKEIDSLIPNEDNIKKKIINLKNLDVFDEKDKNIIDNFFYKYSEEKLKDIDLDLNLGGLLKGFARGNILKKKFEQRDVLLKQSDIDKQANDFFYKDILSPICAQLANKNDETSKQNVIKIATYIKDNIPEIYSRFVEDFLKNLITIYSGPLNLDQ